MTQEQQQWVYSIVDKYSGAADKMAASTDAFNAALQRANKLLDDVGKTSTSSGRKVANSFAGWSGPMGTALGTLQMMATAAKDLAFWLGGGVVDGFKYIVQTLAFKENTLTSLELMLGSKSRADSLYADASLFARLTPFDTQDVVSGFQRLIAAGFNEGQTKVLFQALGDVASTAGERGSEAFGHMVYALSQIRALGHVTMQDLHQLTNWSASMGIGMDTIYEKTAKLIGKTKEQVRALQSSGQLKSDDLIFAFVQAIQERSGGKVGGLLDRQSRTITGLLSTLRSAPFDFINTMDPDKSRGLKAFKGFLENLVGLFDTGTSAGARFASLIDRVFNETFSSLFEDLSGPDGMKRMEAFFTSVITTTGKLYDVISKFLGLLSRLAPSLETIERVLERMNKLVDEGPVAADSPLAKGWKAQAKAGEWIWNNMLDPYGMLSSQPPSYTPGPSYTPNTNQSLEEKNLPGGTVESADLMSKALADSVRQGISFSEIGEAAKRGEARGPISVTIPMTIDGRGADAAAIAEAVRELLPAELERLFERLSTEAAR